jgi:hypothetical protein
MFSKNGQIAGTITWVIATVIIIAVLIISISVVNFTLKKKEFEENSYYDLLIAKSFSGYLLSNDGSGQIFNQVKNEKTYLQDPAHGGKPDKSSLKLAGNIFSIYKEEYSANFWLGIINKDCAWNPDIKANEQPACSPVERKAFTTGYAKLAYDKTKLDNNNILELIITKPTV